MNTTSNFNCVPFYIFIWYFYHISSSTSSFLSKDNSWVACPKKSHSNFKVIFVCIFVFSHLFSVLKINTLTSNSKHKIFVKIHIYFYIYVTLQHFIKLTDTKIFLHINAKIIFWYTMTLIRTIWSNAINYIFILWLIIFDVLVQINPYYYYYYYSNNFNQISKIKKDKMMIRCSCDPIKWWCTGHIRNYLFQRG